jgi:NADPH:quinone reductase
MSVKFRSVGQRFGERNDLLWPATVDVMTAPVTSTATSPTAMTALTVVATGFPPQFSLEAPVSDPSEGAYELICAEVLPLDVQIAQGLFPPTRPVPFQPGLTGAARRKSDGALVIVQGGAFGMGFALPGTFASTFNAPDGAVTELPAGIDPEMAAAGLSNALTARIALIDHARLLAGEHVVVIGARGGAGRAAVSLAQHLGATVTAAVRSPRAGEFEESVAVVDLDIDVAGSGYGGLAALGTSRPADVIFDSVGGATLGAAIAAGGNRCRHVLVGFSGGITAPLMLPAMLLREHRLMGFNLYATDRARLDAATREAIGDVATGVVKPRIKARFGLSAASEAYGSVGGDRVLLVP